MNKKQKKIIITIIILLILAVLIWFFLTHLKKPMANNTLGGSGSSGSSTSTTTTGICPNGGTYRCVTTCTNDPYVPRETPIDTQTERDCEIYASVNNYPHFYFSSAMQTLADCRSYSYSQASICMPTYININGNCCLWRC